MVAATLITFGVPQIHLALDINMILMLSAIAVGSAVAYISAKRVAMTDMPQMIAMYNGMGGGAAAAIAAVELVKLSSSGESHGLVVQVLAVLGAVASVVLGGIYVIWQGMPPIYAFALVFALIFGSFGG